MSIHIFSTSAPLWTPGPRLWALSLGRLLLKLELQTPNIRGKFLCVHHLGFSEKPRDGVLALKGPEQRGLWWDHPASRHPSSGLQRDQLGAAGLMLGQWAGVSHSLSSFGAVGPQGY